MIVLTNRPLLGEDGLNLCVVPPSATEPPLANLVQVLQLDWATGTCPKGYTLIHLSQACRSHDLREDSTNIFQDLERALSMLLGHCAGEDGQRCCLFRCCYLHQPRRLDTRWSPEGPEAEILSACTAGRSLVLCEDPSAVPQLLAGQEVSQARDIFLGVPIYGDEAPSVNSFLQKPAHVAMEEKSSALEDLEYFNEQMQDASRAKPLETAATDAAAAAAASLDKHCVDDGAGGAAAMQEVVASGEAAGPHATEAVEPAESAGNAASTALVGAASVLGSEPACPPSESSSAEAAAAGAADASA